MYLYFLIFIPTQYCYEFVMLKRDICLRKDSCASRKGAGRFFIVLVAISLFFCCQIYRKQKGNLSLKRPSRRLQLENPQKSKESAEILSFFPKSVIIFVDVQRKLKNSFVPTLPYNANFEMGKTIDKKEAFKVQKQLEHHV